jgi:arylsulfatase A-like enzyme
MRLTLLLSLCFIHAAAVAAQPNIVLIFADDLGWKDVGYQGSDFMETPNIDRLAKEGMVFTHGYAAAGNCAPSRACLLSGNYTPRHHVYAVGSTDRGSKTSQRLVPVPNKSGLAQDNITFADALKAAGYVTGIFGKWHLDGKDGAEPAEQGFDVVHESFHGWKDKEKNDQNPKGIYSLTEAAGEFMEKNKDRPFLVYLPHYAIHTALQARPATLERFKAKAAGKQHHDPLYAACTYDLDDGVGLLMKKLKELGLEENTLVVLTSDNGGTQKSSQEPLRGSKGGYYEGGIREPFIVRWPAVTKPGSTCDVPVINVDLFPTFLAAAGATTEKTLDGESLLPLLKGEGELKRQSIFWHFPGYLDDPVIRGRELDVKTGFRTRPVSVIHKGDWKLHLFLEEWQLDGGREKLATNHAIELYNLKDDIGERTDLATQNTAKRDELLDDLLAWHQSIKAVVPAEPNPKYDPSATGKSKKGKGKKKAD